MTPEEVWEAAAAAACYAIKWKPSAKRRGSAVIRTAMEAYAAEKVAEALAAEPTEAMVEAAACAIYCERQPFSLKTAQSFWKSESDDTRDWYHVLAKTAYRAMQAANQHHGGNDADT